MYYIMRVNPDPMGGGAHYSGIAAHASSEKEAKQWIKENKHSSWDVFEILQKIN